MIYFQKLLRDILNLFGVAIFIMHIAFQNRKESLKESIQMRFKLVVGFLLLHIFLCGLYSICKATLLKKQSLMLIQKAKCEKKIMQKTQNHC